MIVKRMDSLEAMVKVKRTGRRLGEKGSFSFFLGIPGVRQFSV